MHKRDKMYKMILMRELQGKEKIIKLNASVQLIFSQSNWKKK
jgi:hypothetical protein